MSRAHAKGRGAFASVLPGALADLCRESSTSLGLGMVVVKRLKNDVTMNGDGEYLSTKHGAEATYELMARQFLAAGRADLANLVCKICNESIGRFY